MLKKSMTALSIFMTLVNGYGQLKVAQIFSDNMVLQRNEPIRIWGWSKAGNRIHVVFNEMFEDVVADKGGTWKASFDPLAAGGPYTLSIRSSEDHINLDNILIGDVWLCSGQSNMEWTLAKTNGASSEINEKINTNIRHFKIPRSFSAKPGKDLKNGEWLVASKQNIDDFTAVGYYFAKEISKNENIPIGLLNSS